MRADKAIILATAMQEEEQQVLFPMRRHSPCLFLSICATGAKATPHKMLRCLQRKSFVCYCWLSLPVPQCEPHNSSKLHREGWFPPYFTAVFKMFICKIGPEEEPSRESFCVLTPALNQPFCGTG